MTLRCDKCGQEFGSDISLLQHLKDKHNIIDSQETSRTVAKASSITSKLSGGIVNRKTSALAGVAVFVAIIIFFLTSTPSVVNAQTVDGIQCNSFEGSVIHIHPHLSIVYNGNNVTVPQIGIKSSCLYWLHTHDSTGTIHLESPTVSNYTLGQFIDVWNKTQYYGNYGPSHNVQSLFNNSITAYVDNTLYSGNYRNIILKDGEQIKLIVSK
ncbi:MAG: hypothetical protein KGH65_03290 [Candidatus Micrarchaeota archaeon]|nr:hypothetical protein [Candidatus Micrarchaeota archaeon]